MRTLLSGVIVAVCLTVAGPAFADEAGEKCVIATDRYTPLPDVQIAELLAAAALLPTERCVPGYSGGGDCQVDSPLDTPAPTSLGFREARDQYTASTWTPPSPSCQRLPLSTDEAGALNDGHARDLERPPQA